MMEMNERVKLLKVMGVFYHHSYQYMKRLLKEKKVSSVEHPLMLLLISREQPILQKDIAKLLRVKPATVSVHLKHLEQEGWIMRQEGKEDKRQSFVSLTPRGEQMLQDGFAMLQKLSCDVTEPLSEEEVIQLESLVRKMLAHLNTKGDNKNA